VTPVVPAAPAQCANPGAGSGPALVAVSGASARAAIARAWPGGGEAAPTEIDPAATLGAVALRPHQRDAVQQLHAILRTASGALLADAVGLGKTYVALAVARDAERPLIIAPATLHPMWDQACSATGIRATILSTEALSRSRAGVGPTPRADLLIVDEAHHFRNPATRRYRALALCAATAPLVLLTATPVHNHPRDLAALLAIFLGARAWTLDEEQQAAYIVRRSHTLVDSDALPSVDPPVWLPVMHDTETLREIVALPSPVPPRDAGDGGDGGALILHSLVRQWASSGGALRAALRRRLERAIALAAALERGRYPSYRDLRAWCAGDGAVQLAFPEMLIPESPAPEPLLDSVRGHAAAVRSLLERLANRPDPDRARVARLRAIRERHGGAKIVAFTAYEDTVRALYRLLRGDPGVCALRASGADVAGGALTRSEALARFAPWASGVPAPRLAERIDLLLTTDLLSEGVNLQDAAIVVHLDLPWTVARMEQRVGRVARLGSAHARVVVYALRPPADANLLLGIERRLRDKLNAAGRSVGVAGSILPTSLMPLEAAGSGWGRALTSPVQHGAIARATVASWRDGTSAADAPRVASADVTAAVTVTATVGAAVDGLVAVCMVGGSAILVASLDGPITDRLSVVARAAQLATDGGDGAPQDPAAAIHAHAAIVRWAERQLAQRDAGFASGILAHARRRVLARIAASVRRARPHRRAQVAALAAAARRAVLTARGIGGEWGLEALAADMQRPDETWLDAVVAGGNGVPPTPGHGAPRAVRVPALILLRRA
jgi:hypothetical protein